MGMFLPSDIATRIINFMAGEVAFPFIDKKEIMGVFYLFGKDNCVTDRSEEQAAIDLARRVVKNSQRDISILRNIRSKLCTDFIRQDYTKRALQVSIELQNETSFDISQLNRRIATDPSILSSCYVEHIAYHEHYNFFELLGPFQDNTIPKVLQKKLQRRMLLLGYNSPNPESLPFENSLIPFLDWMSKLS
jgi:hypothetical protein